jgi:DHA3 family macrolide efflux protein-like MFS transporter
MLTVTLASIAGGIAFTAIGLAPANAMLLAVGMALAIGFVNPIINGSLVAIFQAIIPPEMLGRVLTLILSLTGMTTPLGLAIAGPVGDTLGLPAWFLLSGVVTASLGIVQLCVPAVMRIEDRALASEARNGTE